jgi:hypothetical protein
MKKTIFFGFIIIFIVSIFFNNPLFSKGNTSYEKINRFILSVKNANSKQEVISAFIRENIRKEDLNFLERELKRTGTYQKLSSLMRTHKISRRLKIKDEKINLKLKTLKRDLIIQYKRKTAANNRKVQIAIKASKQKPNRKFLGKINAKTPVIESISNDLISPGQTLVIRGENFLEKKSIVRFHLGSTIINGIIDEWHNTYIITHIKENLSGLTQTLGFVRITNRWGRSTEKQITFIPIEEILTLEDKAYAPALFDRNLNLVLRELGCISYGDKLIEKTTTVHNIKLINGWKVVDYTLGANLFPEVKYVVAPRIGSSYPKSTISIKEHCLLCLKPPYYVKSYLFIKGPRGVKPY